MKWCISWFTCCWSKRGSSDGDSGSVEAVDQFRDDDANRRPLDNTGRPSRGKQKPAVSRSTALVELTKKEGCALGLVVSGGLDKDDRPRVSYLKPGGVAYRSDALQVGDYILAINSIRTVMLRHEEIINLLKNAGHKLLLEIEYELPDTPPATFSVLCKRVEVRLERESDTFGFILRGGLHSDLEKSRPLTVTFIRPGGAADREGTLKVGDRVLAINRVNVTQLSLQESNRILRHADTSVTLLVEYDVSVMEAVQNACTPLLVEIDKAPGASLGITLSARIHKNRRQIYIKTVQPASIADRCGALHPGDQIVSIDDTCLEHYSVTEATQLLKGGGRGSPLRLEIIAVTSAKPKPGGGASMQQATQEFFGRQRGGVGVTSSRVIGGSVQSVASCTSLTTQVGSAVDGMTVPKPHTGPEGGGGAGGGMSNGPAHHTLPAGATMSSPSTGRSPGLSVSHDVRPRSNTLRAGGAGGGKPWVRHDLRHSAKKSTSTDALDAGSSTLPHSSTNTMTLTLQPSCNQVCHLDTTEVTLAPCDASVTMDTDRIGCTYGVLLQDGDLDELLTEPPIITHVAPNTPAERTGILLEGDRVLAINGTPVIGRTLRDCGDLLLPVPPPVAPTSLQLSASSRGPGGGAGRDRDKASSIVLTIEFDVADSIVPSSGVFNVKLFKRGAGLGITISSSSNRKAADPLIISNIKKGSVAHRTGTIQPGDKLLAIDNVLMDNCTIEDAAQVLQNTGDIVKLKIKKDEIFAEECNNTCVTYTVELQKQNGPLGITISGTEEPFDPIIISGLSDGGLAQKTGALHVGDRILAINSSSLRGRPLSDAIQMLQDAGDVVTFRITRPNPASNYNTANTHTTHTTHTTTSAQLYTHSQEDEPRANSADDTSGKISTPLQSVDSALESWDSSGMESNQAKSTSTTAHDTDIGGDSSESSGGSRPQDLQQPRPPSQMVKSGTYNDLNQELHLVSVPGTTYDEGTVSCASSAGGEQDAWSRAVDGLDSITHPDMVHRSETASLASTRLSRASPASPANMSDIPDVDIENISTGSYSTSTKIGADLHLREVEEQLQNIFTPTPVQLHKVDLYRENELEDFGFGLSDGVYEKGVYISAIRRDGPAERSGELRTFDRLLQINDIRTKNLECHQIVPLISDSGLTLRLVISRNPVASDVIYRGNVPMSSSDQSIPRPSSSGVSSEAPGSSTGVPGGVPGTVQRVASGDAGSTGAAAATIPGSSRTLAAPGSTRASSALPGGVRLTGSGLDVDDDGELISVDVLLENMDNDEGGAAAQSDGEQSDIWQPMSKTATVVRAPHRVRIDENIHVETV